MSSPEHLHDLTDEEWKALEWVRDHTTLTTPPFDLRPLVRAGLVKLAGDLWTLTPSGRAHLDLVESVSP